MEPVINPNVTPAPAPENQPNIEAPQSPVAPEVAPLPSAAPRPAAPSAHFPTNILRPVAPPSAAPAVQPVQIAGNPAIADDVDVIEKEWVDQADKIVESTKGDPHLEEESVEALQIDYLKKRYGHDVSKADETQ